MELPVASFVFREDIYGADEWEVVVLAVLILSVNMIGCFSVAQR